MAHNLKKLTVMKQLLLFTAAFGLLLSSCGPMNKTKKGAIIGTAGGAAVGGVIGRATGNTALGVIIGGAVGGTAGVLIGKKMDKQAEEIKKEVPGAKVERVGEGIVVEFTSKILFGFDRSDLMSEAETNLNNLITVLNKYPDTNIEIQGHTDNKGTDEYNMSLAEKRAGTVSGFLKSNGIKSSRISLKPFGESAPKYTNETEEGRAQNRRVDFLITANEKMKADASKETTN
jgi:outer membrane protein OmpA-like peptidoglycan-associated protein